MRRRRSASTIVTGTSSPSRAAELRLALIGVRVVEADAGVGADAVAQEPGEGVLDARGEAPVVAERELRFLVSFAQAARGGEAVGVEAVDDVGLVANAGATRRRRRRRARATSTG